MHGLEGQIPIRTNFREVDGPGTFEADTVAHCGTSMAGEFLWTLTLTDIHTGWTETRAVWNKNPRQIVSRLRDVEERLPFAVVAFDTDNGGEFINHTLVRYFHNRADRVHFTRSRPYHKNDQAHVEQKQFTHVRQLLGYGRLDDPRHVEMINDLCRNEWCTLQNFFLPNVQLLSKSRDGARLIRRHSQPCTPYQRLLNSPKIAEESKEKLRRRYAGLDPFQLHEAIETQLRAISNLARLLHKGATQDPKPATEHPKARPTENGAAKNEAGRLPQKGATQKKRPGCLTKRATENPAAQPRQKTAARTRIPT